MKILPFEGEAPALLAALAQALLPVALPPEEAAGQKEKSRAAAAQAQAEAGRRAARESAGASASGSPWVRTLLPEAVRSFADREAGLSPQALSRAVERDARRFDTD